MPVRVPGQSFLLRVARRIARLRKAAGLTQEELATRLDTATRNIQRIESGTQNLTLLTVAKIAAELGVPPEDLFKDDPPSET